MPRNLLAALLLLLPSLALADSTVPALPTATTLSGATAYLANGGADDNSIALNTSVFGISGGAITINSGGIDNAMLGHSSLTVAGHLISLGGTQTLAASDLTNGTTGSGAVVLATAPTLGAITVTSINKVAVTAPASGSTLTIADGMTLTDTSGIGAKLLLGTAGGGFTGYAGASCTNQFPRSLSTAGAATCASVAIGSDVSGLGTGVATALAVNVGTAGSFVVNGGALGTPSSGTLTSATGLPISTGLTGAGTGVLTALGVNVGSAGAFVTFNGALGTPSSGTLTSATGLPISTGVSGLGTNVATALGVNVGTAGAFVVNGGALGTPSSGTGTNITGLDAGNISAGTLAAARGGAGTVNGVLSGNGSGVVSQGATTGLSDVVAPTSWTPADGSGAALSLTVNLAKYSQFGKIVVAAFNVTYPSTADASQAKISGFPGSGLASLLGGFTITNNGTVAQYNGILNASGVASIWSTAGAPITNVNLSTGTIFGTAVYLVQ